MNEIVLFLSENQTTLSTFENDFYREVLTVSPTPTPTLASYFTCLRIGYEKVADALMIIGTALNVRDMLFDEIWSSKSKVRTGGDMNMESLTYDKQLSKVIPLPSLPL